MKLIIPLLILTFIFPAHLFADTPPSPNPPETETPKVTGIEKGEPAPYSGVLLNSIAAAEIFAEKKYLGIDCDLRVKYAVQREMVRMQLLLDNTTASLNSLQQRHDSINEIKDKEIAELTKIATNKNDYSTWWAAGGVIVGIALSLAVVYGVQQINEN